MASINVLGKSDEYLGLNLIGLDTSWSHGNRTATWYIRTGSYPTDYTYDSKRTETITGAPSQSSGVAFYGLTPNTNYYIRVVVTRNDTGAVLATIIDQERTNDRVLNEGYAKFVLGVGALRAYYAYVHNGVRYPGQSVTPSGSDVAGYYRLTSGNTGNVQCDHLYVKYAYPGSGYTYPWNITASGSGQYTATGSRTSSEVDINIIPYYGGTAAQARTINLYFTEQSSVTGTISVATVTASTLSFSWSKSSSSGGEIRLYSSDGAMLIGTRGISGSSGTVSSFTGLSEGTTYIAYLMEGTGINATEIAHISASTSSGSSITGTLSVTSYSSVGAIVRWTKQNHSGSGTVSIYTNPSGTAFDIRNISGSTGTVSFEDLSPNTTYYVKLIAAGLTLSTITFTTDQVSASITRNFRTYNSLSFNWSKQDGGNAVLDLYNNNDQTHPVKSVGISGISGTANFTGLSPNTIYIVEMMLNGTSVTTAYWVTLSAPALTKFYWTGTESGDAEAVVSGADVESLITSSKWNEAIDKVLIINHSAILTEQETGDVITAFYFNQLKNAIGSLSSAGSVPSSKNPGEPILASDFHGAGSIKQALNNAIDAYNN